VVTSPVSNARFICSAISRRVDLGCIFILGASDNIATKKKAG
jgi:hypothetical protein